MGEQHCDTWMPVAACDMDVATDEVREASWSHASNSPMPGEGMGEVGCIFDEMSNLVEPTERRYMDVPAGPQRSHGWRSVAARTARPDGEQSRRKLHIA